MNSTKTTAKIEREPVLVAEAGVEYVVSHAEDPSEAWMSLMEVVEMLCPVWPERPLPKITVGYKL
jgi:hypothetical protein